MYHLHKTLFSWILSNFGENGPRKKAEQSTYIYKKQKQKQCVQSGISENTHLNQVMRQKELESINLSATNWTFLTKGEIESNFLTILTDEPKLNHWVKTIMNQLGIQFETPWRCILKVTFYFAFFLKIFKKWLKSATFYKTSSGGDKRRYNQKIKQNSHWQDTCEKKEQEDF